MPRFADNDVLDDGLESMKAAADSANGRICVCEGQPATYAEALTQKGAGGKMLAIKTNPTLTIGNNETPGGGRRCRISGESGVPILASGEADCVAIIDTANEKLWFVTAVTLQALVAGGTVDIPQWDIKIRSPIAPA
jgi:hypothetical protein